MRRSRVVPRADGRFEELDDPSLIRPLIPVSIGRLEQQAKHDDERVCRDQKEREYASRNVVADDHLKQHEFRQENDDRKNESHVKGADHAMGWCANAEVELRGSRAVTNPESPLDERSVSRDE